MCKNKDWNGRIKLTFLSYIGGVNIAVSSCFVFCRGIFVLCTLCFFVLRTSCFVVVSSHFVLCSFFELCISCFMVSLCFVFLLKKEKFFISNYYLVSDRNSDC